jgi:hypothetical protein
MAKRCHQGKDEITVRIPSSKWYLKQLSALALNLAASLTLFTAAMDVVLGTELEVHPENTPSSRGDLDNFRRSAGNSDGRGKDHGISHNDRSE